MIGVDSGVYAALPSQNHNNYLDCGALSFMKDSSLTVKDKRAILLLLGS